MSKQSVIKSATTRLSQLRSAMRKSGVDSLIVSGKSTLRYLLGFSGSTGIAVVTKKKIYFVTNDLYTEQIKTEVYPLEKLNILIDRDPWSCLASHKAFKSSEHVGIEPGSITVSDLKAIKKAVGTAKIIEVGDLVSPITQVKTKYEIESIAQAAQIASSVYEKLLGWISAGKTEKEVANFIATTTRALGSEKDAFDIIVVAGTRSAMPHGRASTGKIKKGDVVTVDFGCCVNGFYSDMTRTFCVSSPSKKIVDVFAVLYDAHLTALDATKAGVKASALDMTARSVIEKAGYGEYFRHSLGHGLGYEVHEEPRVSRANSTGTIPENCVITIEPGIYIPGKFGMRIEDDVVVGVKGPEILTTAPRELVVV